MWNNVLFATRQITDACFLFFSKYKSSGVLKEFLGFFSKSSDFPKMWNYVFFATRQITDVCLFVFFSSMTDHIDPLVLECHERAHSKGN